MKKLKPIPKFKNENDEGIFWEAHDSTDYINWNKASLARFPNLKPSAKIISLRLPEGLLNDIKILANKKDVPYQSLIKIMLSREVYSLRKSANQ
jgi:predicted DNA binding CopG/RHH family protein